MDLVKYASQLQKFVNRFVLSSNIPPEPFMSIPMYFEPHHIQYIPVRREVMDIIEVQVAETVGTGDDLAKFGPGHTLVTLHFKQE